MNTKRNTVESYVPDYINEEISGMADGVCSTLGKIDSSCNVTEWATKIQQLVCLLLIQ